MTIATRPLAGLPLLPVAVGLALAWLLSLSTPEGAGAAEPEGPSFIGCHHGADPAPVLPPP
jgi:hypothetical protein